MKSNISYLKKYKYEKYGTNNNLNSNVININELLRGKDLRMNIDIVIKQSMYNKINKKKLMYKN